mgnify:CR=1 FL=1
MERVKLEAGIKKLDVRKENMMIKKESADRNGVTSTQLAGAVMNILSIKERCLGRMLIRGKLNYVSRECRDALTEATNEMCARRSANLPAHDQGE